MLKEFRFKYIYNKSLVALYEIIDIIIDRVINKIIDKIMNRIIDEIMEKVISSRQR